MTSGPSSGNGAPAPVRLSSLPHAAQERITKSGEEHLWSSKQTVGDEFALRRLGFSSAGIVIGSVNSWGVPLQGRTAKWSKLPPSDGTQWQSSSSLDDFVSARRHGGYVHDWRFDGGRPARHIGWTWELVAHERREHQLIDRALSDLLEEVRALGAHGVIGLALRVRHLGTEIKPDYPVLEVAVSGTAVVVPGKPVAERSFTTGLSGTDLLKLSEHGWAPVRFVVGIGHVRGTAGRTSRLALRSMKNGEVGQLSEIKQKSLEIAVQSLERQAQAPSELIVGVEKTVEGKHSEAHVRLTGSALCHLPRGPAPTGLDYLRVVNLSV